MSLVERLRGVRDLHERLMNPPNAVIDEGIDLKRKPKVQSITSIVYVDPREERIKELISLIGKIRTELTQLQQPLDPRAPTTENIMSVVCERFKCSKIDLKSDRRTHPLVNYRQIAMYLVKKLTLRSLPEIGRRFGGRDHTTVLHAVRKIEAHRLTDPILDDQLKEMEAALVPA